MFNDDDNLVGLSVNRKYGMFCDFDATYILHDYKTAEYSAFYGLFYVMIDYYLQQKDFLVFPTAPVLFPNILIYNLILLINLSLERLIADLMFTINGGLGL